MKVSKGAKIRNRYNQVPHLTQDTNGKVINLQLDTPNESQEVSPYPAGDHKAHINRRVQRHSKHKAEQKHKRSTKKYRLGTVSYASVTFATVVVRFICLRFSLRLFGIVGSYKLRRLCLHCLRSPYDFFWLQTRTKPYRDLAEIVRQLQGYRTIIVLSSRPP